ncbi:DNA-binding protein [Ectothiorhodospiraceae bacterium BW-2]|nr:DNA-binding protein [Ectothiorhodospiraceae bacterium BW-2]
MFWTVITRIGTLFSFIYTVKQVSDEHQDRRQIVKPERVYDTREVARILGIERQEVISLLESGQIKGRLIGRNFRIPGYNILEYLKK